MGAVVTARSNARVKPISNNSLLRRPKTVEAILERRARGHQAARIALDLRLVVDEVRDMIQRRRAAGDKRALTDKQAVQMARLADAAAAAPAAAPLPPEPLPETVRRPRIERRPINPEGLLAYVALVRRTAGRIASQHPDAAAGLEHLADLHEHHDCFFPSYVIASEGTTLAQTLQRFPRARLTEVLGTAGTGGGAALACVQQGPAQ